jgi:hypothetical protein
MREQLYVYIQSRLSSKSEFWSDSPYDFNTIGPLKYLMMELIRTKQRTEQPAADVASTPQRRGSISFNSGLTPIAAACGSTASGGSTGSAAEICAIGELVLQLGRAAGEEDITRQIAAISKRLQQLAGTTRAAQDKRQEGNGASSPVISSFPSSGIANEAAVSGRSEAEPPVPVLAAHPTRGQRITDSTTLLGPAARKAKPGPPGPGGPPAGDPPGDGPAADGVSCESSVSPRRMEASGTGLVSPARIQPFDREAWPVARPQQGGRRGSRRGNSSTPAGPSSHPGVQGHGAVSLHYQGRPNDVVLVSGVSSPVLRSTGSHAAVRSTWIEPMLL